MLFFDFKKIAFPQNEFVYESAVHESHRPSIE